MTQIKKSVKIKKIALTGGAAAAEALRQLSPDVMAVYPITPQTPIIETYAKLKADGEVDTEIIQVESEHSAMSASVGASAAGARTVTATSSQGLALMNEILYIASGMRLPILMLVSSRALSAPLSIHGDHSDVMGARDTGWLQIFSENTQEVYDNTIIGMRLAERVGLPVMVIMDGFNTSHSVEVLNVIDDKSVLGFAGKYFPENFLLDIKNPKTFGPVSLQNSHFEFKIDQAEAMEKSRIEFGKITKEYNKLKNDKYSYFESYRLNGAERVIVVAGSTAGTVKNVVDQLRSRGEKVGLLKIKLFRPFPFREITEALQGVERIAVLDRALSFGSKPPVFSELLNCFYDLKTQPEIRSYVFGLGGREIFAKDIEKVFDDLLQKNQQNNTQYIK